MQVPFLDLTRQYQRLKEEIDEVFEEILDSQHFILGEYVERFERSFAKYCDSKYCISVNSGTSALYLALLANGIDYWDEVITVPNTFIATAEAISMCGAKPLFVDIDEKTYNLDPEKIEESITENTKAILPVHLYGQSADMNRINEIAEKYNIKVIEDACQAHGAEYKGRKVGSLGDMAAFSFYPGKNLGAYGEGGAVVTSDKNTAEIVKSLRDHGSTKKYYHQIIGGNFRMDAFQGAVLKVKLKYLDEWNEKRRKKAKYYYEELPKEKLLLPIESSYNKHIYHLYVIRTKHRDELQKHLAKNGISTGIHYPIPIHLQKAYKWLNLERGRFPYAEKISKEILSLPMFPELTAEELKYIAEKIKDFYGS